MQSSVTKTKYILLLDFSLPSKYHKPAKDILLLCREKHKDFSCQKRSFMNSDNDIMFGVFPLILPLYLRAYIVNPLGMRASL